MRVFVAGATGVVGRRAVSRLVAAGHEVTGVSRSPEKDALLESLGARPVRVDLFDVDALRVAITGHDAVVNVTTKIPPIAQMARVRAWDENERIRRVASGNLVDAAIGAGAAVFVQESLAFMYGEHGSEWIDAASTPLVSAAFTGAIETAEANVARFAANGGRGVVLRFGRFYAPEADQSVALVNSARRGLMLDLGAADSYTPMIDADDAAAAVVRALDATAGTYDVVESEPLPRREQAAALGAAVGRRRLRLPPKGLAPKSAGYLSASQRVSSRAFQDATGWRPLSPSVREGYRKIVRERGVEPALPGRARLMLWLLAASAFALGVQAEFFPRQFYSDFPFGRGWVAMDGRYNEHLIRDFGALNLAIFVLTAGAIFVGTRAISRIAAVSWIVYSVPHLVYHLRHLTMVMPGADKVGMIVSLSVPIVLAIVVLFDRVHASAPTVDARPPTPLPGANLTPMSARR
ncbi:MAG: NAD-dependent epimerase/dehydratase [Actinomycetia bacterium]|nr:NAD-dependent epimerase/dehydratase [Actinomycetes bacterium]